MRVLRGPALLTALGATLLAPQPTTAQRADERWRLIEPSSLTLTGRLVDRRLGEASGAALSRANPGLIWTIGDSGNPPDLLAVDTTGAVRAVFRLQGIANVDWESVAVGPCGLRTCVYVADVGDNAERRAEVVIHRFTEPSITGREAAIPADQVESLRFRYADRPHDTEAMAVAPDGRIMLVTKGRTGGIFAFGLGPELWRASQPVVATAVDTLPIVPSQGTGRVVTGMAMSPDGRRVQIRTYRELYLFEHDQRGRLVPANWTSCNILGREPQGEAVAWLDDRRTVLLSERGLLASGTVIVVECQPD
jgi:hypothetical protein